MDFLRTYNDSINTTLTPLDAPAAAGFLKLLLVLYAGLFAPNLPKYVLDWFKFVPFKILILFLIVWTGNHDPALSITVAVAFFMTLNVVSGKQAFEAFRPVYPHERDD